MIEDPYAVNIVKRYTSSSEEEKNSNIPPIKNISQLKLDITGTNTRRTFPVQNIGGKNVPIVIADFNKKNNITPADLDNIGYKYDIDYLQDSTLPVLHRLKSK